jgi:hypothetical protein
MPFKHLLSIFTFALILTFQSQAQKVHFMGDLQLFGIGSVNQNITSGNNTERSNITGLSGISAGINISLPYNFEVNVLAGLLFNIGMNSSTTYSASGNTSSSSSQSLVAPRTGMELTYNVFIEDQSFIRGVSFGAGLDQLWSGRFRKSDDAGSIDVRYHGTVSPFFRLKMIIKPLGRFNIQPYLSYRTFDFEGHDFTVSGDYQAPDASLMNPKGRNLEFGAVVIIKSKN